MSDHTPFGFGKFIPGFDFLQNLSKAGQSSASMPPLSHWVAPTVSIEEVSKRIEELKAVQFWLEQNSRALAATVQALEVQKMTLSTLQGMNVSMADLAQSFTHKATPATATPASDHADWPMSSSAGKSKKNGAPAAHADSVEGGFSSPSTAQPQATEPPAAGPHEKSTSAAQDKGSQSGAAAGMADPMLWWGALSQQFQQIASQALHDPAQQQALAQASHIASDFTKAAMNAASSMVRQASEGVQAAASTAAQAAAHTVAKTVKKPATKAATPAAPRSAQPAAKTPVKAAAPAATKTPAKRAAKAPAPATVVKKAAGTKRAAAKAPSRAAAPSAAARPRSR